MTKGLRIELAIYGLMISIIDNKTNKVIATNTFFESHVRNDVKDFRCGSYADFIGDALGLRKRFSSIYD